jgi:hypothetical protein
MVKTIDEERKVELSCFRDVMPNFDVVELLHGETEGVGARLQHIPPYFRLLIISIDVRLIIS